MIYEELMKYDYTNLQNQLQIAILKQKQSYEEKSTKDFNFWRTQVELINDKIENNYFFS